MKKGTISNQIRQKESLNLSVDAQMERIAHAPFGEKTKRWAKRWIQHESGGGVGMGLFTIAPVIESARGSYLYDADGKEYLDFLSGFSVSALGNNNQEINRILKKQMDTLTHYFDLPHIERVKLAEKLCKLSGIRGKTKVMFGVTGSDAIELAIRAARYHTGNPYILTAYGDYHGVTYGTMGLTSKGNMQPYFYPIRPNTDVGYFPCPHPYRKPGEPFPGFDMNSLRLFEQMLDGKETPFTDGVYGVNNVAAILVEPFQSSAGYYVPFREYLKDLRRIADKFGMLLIVDEIQTGLGRSGKLWAFEHSEIEPDMICTSKALGGGLPLSAVIGRAEILEDWGPAAYVSTQAGNALACAVGNYILEVVSSESFLQKVNERGCHIVQGLKDLKKAHKIIGYIDNTGIYTGIELVKDRKTKEPASDAAAFVRDKCVQEGLLFEKGGYYHNRLQLIPPLNIEVKDLDRALGIFDRVFGGAEKKFGIG